MHDMAGALALDTSHLLTPILSAPPDVFSNGCQAGGKQNVSTACSACSLIVSSLTNAVHPFSFAR